LASTETGSRAAGTEILLAPLLIVGSGPKAR
jgi:hypothetical protein